MYDTIWSGIINIDTLKIVFRYHHLRKVGPRYALAGET